MRRSHCDLSGAVSPGVHTICHAAACHLEGEGKRRSGDGGYLDCDVRACVRACVSRRVIFVSW